MGSQTLSNKYRDLLADHERLVKEIDSTQGILDSIEAARGQLSVLGDELRGQTTIVRERVAWLIRQMDVLKFKLEALATTDGTSP
jgi:hypothetical protein